MPSIGDILEVLQGRRGRLTVFCGAGLSVGSGLPTVTQLLDCILRSLDIDPADMRCLKGQGDGWCMPFEAFMDAFIEHDQNTRLFDIFLLGQPNQNHFLIKRLALEGSLREVCTTNFDLLIEQVLGASPAVPFDRVLDSQPNATSGEVTSLLPLVKLHGTADDKSTIRSTIRSISSGATFETRRQLVKGMVSSPSEVLWVWGYSCSDVLDITPALMEGPPTHKLVILTIHDPSITNVADAVVAPLSETPGNNPFRAFVGHSIRVDSNALVRELLQADGIPSEAQVDAQEWHAIVKDWIRSFPHRRMKYSILCHLFYDTAQYDLALKYNAMAIEANDGDDVRGTGAALSNRGLILHKRGDGSGALAAFTEALELFLKIAFPFGVATSYNNIGYALGYLGRSAEGHLHLEMGLQYIEAHEFREGRLCRGYLAKSRGELQMRDRQLFEAEQSYDAALDIFTGEFVAEAAEVMMLKGILYRGAGRLSDSDAMLRRARELAGNVGHLEVVRESSRLLGT